MFLVYSVEHISVGKMFFTNHELACKVANSISHHIGIDKYRICETEKEYQIEQDNRLKRLALQKLSVNEVKLLGLNILADSLVE